MGSSCLTHQPLEYMPKRSLLSCLPDFPLWRTCKQHAFYQSSRNTADPQTGPEFWQILAISLTTHWILIMRHLIALPRDPPSGATPLIDEDQLTKFLMAVVICVWSKHSSPVVHMSGAHCGGVPQGHACDPVH